MARNKGIQEFLDKKFDYYDVNSTFKPLLGLPEKNFRAIVWGDSGSGKTTLSMQMTAYLSTWGKVYYNSVEQGLSKSLQDVALRCNIDKCKPGSIMFDYCQTFEGMVEKIDKGKPRFVFIDSIQYMSLTVKQYIQLIETFPRRAFVLVSWCDKAGNPKYEAAQNIRYMVDIKIQTYQHNNRCMARSDSRFGQTSPYTILTKTQADVRNGLFG